MSVITAPVKEPGIVYPGLHPNLIHYQTAPAVMLQQSLDSGTGRLCNSGALAVDTGKFTGRSPQDRFIVKDACTTEKIHWNDFNLPLEEAYFEEARRSVLAYLNSREELWVRDAYLCADARYRMNVRVVTETAWASLFAHNMFLRPEEQELDSFEAEWTILAAPGLSLDPVRCGIRQSNAAIISFQHKTILIAGTGYTGEIKKGMFSVLNFILPSQQRVLSMHCSANMGRDGKTALFFGLSGTGKTTLSADPARRLIGDDEHGWSDNGIFNFEGGCYAKCIDLNEEKEPDIFRAIRCGALLENIAFYPGSNQVDYSNRSITENTRVSYPLSHIANAVDPSIGAVPSQIFFLTCDAYGVLPPIARLNKAQAMYQFISGYTARVAGTEAGVNEPRATFSACFGAPFLPLHPATYANLLGEKLAESDTEVWLINTGWSGGPVGKGNRMPLPYTRAMIRAVMQGALRSSATTTDPIFGLEIPLSCPGVPADLLLPEKCWESQEDWQLQARQLAGLFVRNFEKYTDAVSEEILAAGPRL
jgi:phosphoenolpyruvate carboxykinase (ATP)